MTIKNRDLFRLLAGFRGCAGLRGVKFAYAVAKNARTVGAVCEDLRAGLKGETFQAYAKAMAVEGADPEALALAHPEAAAIDAEFNAMLEETAGEIKLHTVALDLVPEDISAGQFEAIMEMIEE